MNETILIVDDEEEMCLSLREILTARGYRCLYTTDTRNVGALLEKNSVDLAIIDIRMPGLDGIGLLRRLRDESVSIPVIMITGYPSIDNAVKAMKYGASNFYVKPLKIKMLLEEISHIFESRRNRRVALEEEKLITENPRMRDIMRNARKVAPTEAAVLIQGESGTGKELVASFIHRHSGRKGPFVKVNCAAIPDTLLESELFGHERGAFTDARCLRKGKFEMADEGTLFLDEIGDMSVNTQPKILRVLQDKEIERLGGNRVYRIDTRIISATNKNVEDMVKAGLLREDLFYRLSVVAIELPPLRERKEDIMLLAEHFIDRFNRQYNRTVRALSDEVRQIFMQHDWPGNLRELKNCIERAVIFSEGEVLETDYLALQYRNLSSHYEIASFHDLEYSMNRAIISEALKMCNGNKQKAARLMNIHRKTLYNRMKKLGME